MNKEVSDVELKFYGIPKYLRPEFKQNIDTKMLYRVKLTEKEEMEMKIAMGNEILEAILEDDQS